MAEKCARTDKGDTETVASHITVIIQEGAHLGENTSPKCQTLTFFFLFCFVFQFLLSGQNIIVFVPFFLPNVSAKFIHLFFGVF